MNEVDASQNNVVQLFPTAEALSMTSLEIAELTGKRHDHVVRDVRNMLNSLEILTPQIWGVRSTDRGRTYEVAILDKELTYTLITGYSIPLRNAVIKRWLELEGSVASVEPTLQSLQAQIAELTKLVMQLTVSTPPARTLEAPTFMTPSDLGRPYGIDARPLNKILAYNGFQTFSRTGWIPTDKAEGLCQVKVTTHRNGARTQTVRWRSEVLCLLPAKYFQ